MSTAHVMTSALLRQFAVKTGSSIEVSTKLGPHTLLRTSFDQDAFPDDSELQASFLKSLIDDVKPGALDILAGNVARCLEDQATAVRKVIQAESKSATNNQQVKK